MRKTYQELLQYKTFEERFEYLKLNGVPTEETFGGHRILNQFFYKSKIWKDIRNRVIIRDNGCDLAIEDRPIITPNRLLIHHINPITIEMIQNEDPEVFDLNNLITVSHATHNAIHYGSKDNLIPSQPTERKEGDTTLWQTTTFAIS